MFVKANIKIETKSEGGAIEIMTGYDGETSFAQVKATWANTIINNLAPMDYDLRPLWEVISTFNKAKGDEFERYLVAKWKKNGILFI